jgi:hypothetical protein
MSFWVAGAAVVAGVGGAVISSEGNKKASERAAQGSQGAIDESARQFNTIQRNTAPYRAIGEQALNSLGSIYGYAPANSYFGRGTPDGTPYTAGPIKDGNFFNSGAGSLLNPWTVTSKLGSAGKFLDPAGGLLGNLFGGGGSKERDIKAFTRENEIYDLGNGMLSLADGTTFRESQLRDVAGAWYGATYAPDGDQEGWKQRYAGLVKAPATPSPQAGASPQVAQGGSPTNALAAPDYSAFFKSPDYTFRRDEGLKGIERTAAARGGAFSGNALKALNEFNSNLAAGEFGNYFNRQAALAGIGQTATAQTNQAGLITANQTGNALQNQGDARASGVAGSYNAWGNALSGVAQGAGYYFGNRSGAAPDTRTDPSGIGYFKPTVRRV